MEKLVVVQKRKRDDDRDDPRSETLTSKSTFDVNLWSSRLLDELLNTFPTTLSHNIARGGDASLKKTKSAKSADNPQRPEMGQNINAQNIDEPVMDGAIAYGDHLNDDGETDNNARVEDCVMGFTQTYIESLSANSDDSGDDEKSVHVTLTTLMIYLSSEYCILELSFEYRDVPAGHSAFGKPILQVWANRRPMVSRAAFFRHVNLFHQTLCESHASMTAILPYAYQTYSVEFQRGFFDPIYTSEEVSRQLKRAHDVYDKMMCRTDRREKIHYPWNTRLAVLENPKLWKPRIVTNKIRARWQSLVMRYDGMNGGEACVKFCRKYSNTSPADVSRHFCTLANLANHSVALGWFSFCRLTSGQLNDDDDDEVDGAYGHGSDDSEDEEFSDI